MKLKSISSVNYLKECILIKLIGRNDLYVGKNTYVSALFSLVEDTDDYLQ